MTDFQSCWEGHHHPEWGGPRPRHRSSACNGVHWWGASGWWQGWIFYFILWRWVWLLYIFIPLFLSHVWTPKYLTWNILDFVLTLPGPSACDYLTKMMFCPNIELSPNIINFGKINWNWAWWNSICSLQRMPFIEPSLLSEQNHVPVHFRTEANYFQIQKYIFYL